MLSHHSWGGSEWVFIYLFSRQKHSVWDWVPFSCLTTLTFSSPHSSLATGAQTTVRTRCRVWFWTRLERWFIVLEVSGMKAFSVTPWSHQRASGSPVSEPWLSAGKVLKSPDNFSCWSYLKYHISIKYMLTFIQSCNAVKDSEQIYSVGEFQWHIFENGKSCWLQILLFVFLTFHIVRWFES